MSNLLPDISDEFVNRGNYDTSERVAYDIERARRAQEQHIQDMIENDNSELTDTTMDDDSWEENNED